MNILTPPKLSTGKVGGEFDSSASAAAVVDEEITGGSDAAKSVGSADVGRAGEPGDGLAPGDSLHSRSRDRPRSGGRSSARRRS